MEDLTLAQPVTPVTRPDRETLRYLARQAVADAVNELSEYPNDRRSLRITAIRNLRADAGLDLGACMPLVDEAIRERNATRTSDRRLLAAVSRWAHANGWERGICAGTWSNTVATWTDKTLPLTEVWFGKHNSHALTIRATDGRYGPSLIDVSIPDVTSVRLAVDLLVAYGILPAEFSSAYTAGRASAGRAA